MPRLTTAQALVRFLSVQHSERDGERQRLIGGIFGIFGHGNVCALSAALSEPAAGLTFHQPKHEQAMVHTALGYAKARRRLSTLACTTSIGPGATNLVTGAATATTNRLPVLLLPADTFATRRQGAVLQQLQHPSYRDWTVNDCLRPVSRFFDRISRPEQLLDALPEAMRVLVDPVEAGAVTIALHQDVQGEAGDVPAAFLEPRVWRVPRPAPDAAAVAAAAALLRAAERPLVIAGGGVRYSEAEPALERFARATGVPVAETSAGKGLVPTDATVGGVGVNGTRAANDLARDADVVVCVGTRLTDFTTGSRSLFQAPDVRFVGVNVAASDAVTLGVLPVVADARVALEALLAELADWSVPAEHAARTAAVRDAWRRAVSEDLEPRPGVGLTQGQVLRTLNESAQAGDWVVAAAGSPPGDLLKVWDAPPGSGVHIEFGFSCMGHELPAGLGVRMADPDAGEILVVIGDGTFLMSPTELVTALQERLKVTVVVLVNGGYQSIHGLQLGTVGRSFGNEFRVHDAGQPAPAGEMVAPDHAGLARSLGCRAWNVDNRADLEAALRAARAHAGPALIACHVEVRRSIPDSGCWWDLGVAAAAVDERTRELAGAHAARAAEQRWYG